MIFPFKQVIFRFHVNFPGCTSIFLKKDFNLYLYSQSIVYCIRYKNISLEFFDVKW